MERFKIKRLNDDVEDSPLVIIDKEMERMFISDSDDDALDCLSYWKSGIDATDLCSGLCLETVTEKIT